MISLEEYPEKKVNKISINYILAIQCYTELHHNKRKMLNIEKYTIYVSCFLFFFHITNSAYDVHYNLYHYLSCTCDLPFGFCYNFICLSDFATISFFVCGIENRPSHDYFKLRWLIKLGH